MERYTFLGLHDISSIFLLVLEKKLALNCLIKLKESHINDFMNKNINKIIYRQPVIQLLINKEDKELGKIFKKLNLNESNYSIRYFF
jgi:hypothetical protein